MPMSRTNECRHEAYGLPTNYQGEYAMDTLWTVACQGGGLQHAYC